MLLTPFAVVAGFLTGLLRGGRFENLLDIKLIWAPVILLGFAVQTMSELADVPARLSVFIVGAFILIVGLCQNLHIRGLSIVVVGLSANLVATVANGYVPVRLEALIGAGKVEPTIDPDTIVSIGALGQLEDDKTQLNFLGDIVPIGLINDVVSFGDLILIAGLFVVAMNLVIGRRRSGATLDDVVEGRPDTIDLRADTIEAPAEVTAPTNSEPIDVAPRVAESELAEPAGLTPDEFLAELAAAGDESAY